MKLWTVFISAALGLLIAATTAFADVYVRGYYRWDGTYVQPHYRSSPNSTPLDNWSTRGNINPYTGKRGTRNPYSGYTNPYGGRYQPYGSQQQRRRGLYGN